MRIGNTTEREAPWKIEFRFDRLIPPKWTKPFLVWSHALLKYLTIFIWAFGIPGLGYMEKGKGFLMKDIKEEITVFFMAFLPVVDFFMTKCVFGPKITGLHHEFKKDDNGKIIYHYYAEKDFLSRYPAVDRDGFFSFLVIPSFFWVLIVIPQIFRLKILYILLSAIGFTSVYLNLYLFVQVRYYTQWSMSKFFSTWLYNFFVHIYNMDDYGTENDFRNAYDNRVRY